MYATVAKRWEAEIKAGTTRRSIHPRKSDSQPRKPRPKGPKKPRRDAVDQEQPKWQADGRFSKFDKAKS